MEMNGNSAAELDLQAALEAIIALINTGWDDAWLITGPHPQDDNAGVTQPNPRYGQVDEVHHHEFTEICAGVLGECRLNIRGKKYTVDRGRLAVIIPGTRHMEVTALGTDYLVAWISVHITKTVIHFSGKNASGELYTIQGCTLEENDGINVANARIVAELRKRPIRYETMVRTLVLQLLLHIIRLVEGMGSNRPEINNWKDRIVNDVQKYIENQYQKHLTLTDISREMCVSINYLNTIFKNKTGTTIMQHVQTVKLAAAKTLLQSEEKTIKEIADLLGYYDQYHFSKVFKKEVGSAPSEFRRKNLNPFSP
jgi:AraC family transcriptional regulator, transcriptional activator for feuABC-ybbA operon